MYVPTPKPMSIPRKLWDPSKDYLKHANLTQYSEWLFREYQFDYPDYESLWAWSARDPAAFWETLWHYFRINTHSDYRQVMSDDPMPHTRWFEGSTLNYAEHVFRNKTRQRSALLYGSERQSLRSLSWDDLEFQTAALQTYLKQTGVGLGDRVAAYLPNIPQATVSLLATLSLGAVWSSCSPDFGTESLLDRFRQIEPKVLIVVDGYQYGGKAYDRMGVVRDISRELPSVEKVIVVPSRDTSPSLEGLQHAILWDDVMATGGGRVTFTPVPFAHPIWVLYSSGTTGIPKAITHSHGGMLLEHLKYLSFHNDLRVGDTFFWYATTGWMMWNFLQASLLVGAVAVLYDGSPSYPDLGVLWKLAAEAPINHFGTSAPFLLACMKAGIHPGTDFTLSPLRSIGSTGAPLPPEGFDYVYGHIKKEVWLCSMSGGTDVCTAWVGGCPWRPVYEGEIQCRCLGCAMEAYSEEGKPLENSVGEMVVTRPMPCMPVFFWDDPAFTRYTSSYFGMFPGVWRHGDWIRITSRDGVVILGRSDTTLNRQGIRIGTAEIYRAMARIPRVADSLIVNLELPQGGDYMPLFVVLADGERLTEDLKREIIQQIRTDCSPRHVPDAIIVVPAIPYTISGKKMEAPVKKILSGIPTDQAAGKGTMRNPESLDFFASLVLENK